MFEFTGFCGLVKSNKIKIEMGGVCSTYGGDEKCVQMLTGKPEG
jgi:hypothetical protein